MIVHGLGLTALLLAAPAAAGTVRAAPVAPVRVSAALGAIVPGSGAGFMVPDAASGFSRMVPWDAATHHRALDPQRAAVLVERLGGAIDASAAPAAAEGESAARLLGRVNAVMGDFSPEELREMPIDRLRALASIAFEEGESSEAHPVEAIAAITEARTRALLARRGQPGDEFWPFPRNAGIDGHFTAPVHTDEVPASVKVAPKGVVYRHFTSKRGLESILATRTLNNSFNTYVEQVVGVWRKHFDALTAVFLTVPGEKGPGPGGIGVSEGNSYWADVLLPEEFTVLSIDNGRIFGVPLPGRRGPDVVQRFWEWVKGDKGAVSYFYGIPRMPHAGVDIRIPVQIVDHSPLDGGHDPSRPL